MRGNSVREGFEMRVNLFKLPGQIGLIDVAQGDDLGILVSQKRVQVLHSAVTDANTCDPHPIVCSDHPAGSRDGGRRRRACKGSLGTSPPVQLARHIELLGKSYGLSLVRSTIPALRIPGYNLTDAGPVLT